MKKGNSQNNRVVATNKKAYHDYFIEDTYEAGIVLAGREVKSVRLGRVNLRDSYCAVKGGQMTLINAHISPYEKATAFVTQDNPRRDRRLLLHRSEINKLRGKTELKGYTLVPLKMYFKEALVKVEIGLAKGKELHDKRDAIAEKESRRKVERELKNYR